MAISGLTEGRTVHYVLDEGRSKGEHRPAVVVHVFDRENGTSNLHVHVDGANDDYHNEFLISRTSVLHSDGKEPGTWHFIEYVE